MVAKAASMTTRYSDLSEITSLINGVPPVRPASVDRVQPLPNGRCLQGSDVSDCHAAVETSTVAFRIWSRTSPLERRRLLLGLADLIRLHRDDIKQVIQDEIHCTEGWAEINVSASISMIEETAALVTSGSMGGVIPHTETDGSYGFVFARPLGVVLGIAPWNSPLILGFRAVLAPVAAGNTAILKGSELSPRTHSIIARLFLDAGFPPGVVNFILHRAEDASAVVDALVTHAAVRKVNFTGSTRVGRIIAEKAGRALKPVLLELGGKNCSIVLEDADLARAAKAVLDGATLNGGQICMSTDLVVVIQKAAAGFREKLQQAFNGLVRVQCRLISSQSASRVRMLAADAVAKGAVAMPGPQAAEAADQLESEAQTSEMTPFYVLDNIQPSMDFFALESFGPMLGVVVVPDEEAAIQLVNGSEYGLSAAIWTRDQHRALGLAQQLDVGAVHINASTVHDEATLPHGGCKSSGFGRFNAAWGLCEFVQTQTVVLHH